MPPSDVEYDEVAVNLKVIASIQVNTKLYTKGAYLNIEQPMFIPESLRRWYRQDSRDEAIKAGARSLTAAFWRLVFDGDPHAGRLLREPTREWPRLGPVLAAWEAQA